MTYNLFLDDERFPEMVDYSGYRDFGNFDFWVVVRNIHDAQYYIDKHGLPVIMSLDHDLGNHKFTGMEFVKWLVNDYLIDGGRSLGSTIVHVHSMNPIGKMNMLAYIDSYLMQI